MYTEHYILVIVGNKQKETRKTRCQLRLELEHSYRMPPHCAAVPSALIVRVLLVVFAVFTLSPGAVPHATHPTHAIVLH